MTSDTSMGAYAALADWERREVGRSVKYVYTLEHMRRCEASGPARDGRVFVITRSYTRVAGAASLVLSALRDTQGAST